MQIIEKSVWLDSGEIKIEEWKKSASTMVIATGDGDHVRNRPWYGIIKVHVFSKLPILKVHVFMPY